jgi:hypothetical protein
LISLHLPGRPWDAVAIPATSIIPSGLAAPATQDTTDGCWLFPAGVDSSVSVVWTLPPSWLLDSDVNPHIRWWKTVSAAGTVNWELDWRLAPLGSVAGAYVGASAGTPVVADADTAELHAQTSWSIAAPTLGFGGLILATLTRQSAAAGDTYASDVKLLSADLHIKLACVGTRSEYAQ